MTTIDADEAKDIEARFSDAVNMTPKELKDWLDTDESKSVGVGEGESVGHHSGRRIVEVLEGKKADRTQSQYEHMRKVTGVRGAAFEAATGRRCDGDEVAVLAHELGQRPVEGLTTGRRSSMARVERGHRGRRRA